MGPSLRQGCTAQEWSLSSSFPAWGTAAFLASLMLPRGLCQFQLACCPGGWEAAQGTSPGTLLSHLCPDTAHGEGRGLWCGRDKACPGGLPQVPAWPSLVSTRKEVFFSLRVQDPGGQGFPEQAEPLLITDAALGALLSSSIQT